MKNIQLYVHIPFCVKKCSYCDFLSFTSTQEEQKSYVEALINEIKACAAFGKECMISTIFIGGGTPSVLEGALMEQIVTTIRNTFQVQINAEITMELNPQSLSEKKIQHYKNCGINRISMGLQATNNDELITLGRVHNYETFLQCYESLRANGFDQINIDLMSAIPGQNLVSWEETLDKVLELKPEHISAYSLIIEEGTEFYDLYSDENAQHRDFSLPSEKEERDMYYLTKSKLQDQGYERYEISNYAKSGFICRHNCGYWEDVPYIGFGLGASSYIQTQEGNYRYVNTENIQEYIDQYSKKKIKEFNSLSDLIRQDRLGINQEGILQLSQLEQMEEFLFLGLRKIEGISKGKFLEKFHIPLEQVYGDTIANMKKLELLKETKEGIALTERGIDVSNYVLSSFLK